ncbi:hypothetical protein L1987_52380 [Smallanthus sonchifolius]|uniref:Uncharacterized protein n=1 Tax=Smallanthus sonchifolius TaxID=185202 RepID=A0ACB9ESZ8_9ASTR|nr:hypothetical protein L1987_52380 [Smallanthus sonchifolius]
MKEGLNFKMSVVGFDIGNENCVIAAARNREIDVLLNDYSNLDTPVCSCVSWNPLVQDDPKLLPFKNSEAPNEEGYGLFSKQQYSLLVS